MITEFIAHRRKKDGQSQSLRSHLTRVSVLAGQFADKIGLKEVGRVIGILHDIGKASNEFNKYIKSATGLIDPDADDYVEAKEQRGKIDHSSAGAQIIYKALSQKGPEGVIAAQVLSLCVASHHSGLIDCLSPDGQDNFTRRIKKPEEKTHTDEASSCLTDNDKQKLIKLLSSEVLVKQMILKIKSLKENNDHQDTVMFKYGLLVRFLFSCLIDADRLNTADFEFPNNVRFRNYGEYHPWDVLIERLNVKLNEFENKKDKNEVDDLRTEVSQQCFDFAPKSKGIYQLTVPTGGGKTLASLRFALNHAAHHKMERVFYIIPFTSIIDQNAEEARKILEEKDATGKYMTKVVLEHHSNLTPEEETRRQNLLSENWDAPIVFTTQVQFLETLFGSGTRGARRMHQLANSVIIFDEVQTIPVRCVHMFNVAVRFLVNNCSSTVVLCTATQPLLDKVEPAHRSLTISSEQRMMSNEKELFKKLTRIKVYDNRKIGGWSEEKIAELTRQELHKTGGVLVIVNTKKSARALYQKLIEKNLIEVHHLSTNMCPAHRLNVLDVVRARLHKNEPVICVSTQLIEAGIDIDFGTVIRYLAGLDSIAQAAGRCNRNGKRKKPGKVYILNPKEENIERLKDIKIGAQDAERVLQEYKDHPKHFGDDRLGLKAMEQFYKYYFYNRKHQMSYPVPRDNRDVGRVDDLFNLLSLNSISVQEYQRIYSASPPLPFKQSFQSAANAFRAIDSPTRGIIVQYEKEGKEIVNDLCAAFEVEKQYKLLKRAQRFSVNVYPRVFDELCQQKAIHEVQEGTGIFYLDAQYYDNKFGLSKAIINEMETLIAG